MKKLLIALLLTVSLSYAQNKKCDSLRLSNSDLRHKYEQVLKIAREKAKESSQFRILNEQNVSKIIQQTEEIKKLQFTIDSLRTNK